MASKLTGKQKLGGALGAAGAGALAVIAMFEGFSHDPYDDIAGIPTVCYGETRVAMRHYTKAECDDMLAGAVADFGKGVLERNPELRGHDAQLVAATSLAYNIGLTAYSRSTVAKRFSQGRWREACDAFLLWTKAGGRTIPGLLKRRQKERLICLREL